MSDCSSLSLVSWSRKDAMGQTSSIHYSELMKGAVSPNEPVGWGYPNERKLPPTDCQNETVLRGLFPRPGKYYCISVVYEKLSTCSVSLRLGCGNVPESKNNEETSCSSPSSESRTLSTHSHADWLMISSSSCLFCAQKRNILLISQISNLTNKNKVLPQMVGIHL